MIQQFMFVVFAVLALSACMVSGKCSLDVPNDCRDDGLNAANRRFSYTMLRRVAQQSDDSENIFLSPLVVGTMLSMLLQGSSGETEEEIKTALKWNSLFNENDSKEDPTKEEAHCVYKYYNGFSSNLTSEEDVLQLKTANKIFGGAYNFSEEIVETLENLRAPMEKVDFGKPDEAIEHINNWVAENTNERINKIFEPGSLPGNTVMALVSAIYFKGLWETPFQTSKVDETFTLHSEEEVKVPYMGRTGTFKFFFTFEEPYMQFLEVPYKQNTNGICINASMIFIYDVKGDTKRVEKDLLTENKVKEILKILGERQPMNANVKIPKFAITAEYDLIPILKSMGVNKSFTADADFKNFIDEDSRDGTPPLYVSKAVHKSYVQVDEKGTEAAAAAGSGIVPLSLPPTFRFERPFHFMIYDRSNDNILFIGRLSDPSAAK